MSIFRAIILRSIAVIMMCGVVHQQSSAVYLGSLTIDASETVGCTGVTFAGLILVAAGAGMLYSDHCAAVITENDLEGVVASDMSKDSTQSVLPACALMAAGIGCVACAPAMRYVYQRFFF